MKSKLLRVFIIFSIAQIFWGSEIFGQTFTTTQNGNWNTAGIWTRSNFCGLPGQENNNGINYSAPPPTGSFFPACQINVFVNHNVTFNAGTQFGAGYFKSLNVSSSATLTFPSGFTTANSGSSVGGVVYNFSNNSIIAVNGVTTFNSNVQVNLNSQAVINSTSMVIDGGSDVFVNGNSSINLSGLLTIRANGQLRITGSSTVIVDALTFQGNNSNIYVEEGSSLIVRNATTMPQGPSSIVIEGNFQTGSMTINGGQNRLNINGEGTANIAGNLNLDGDGRLDLNGNAGVVVEGTITISNSGGSGIDQETNTDLIVLSSGSSFAPGKIPVGGCFQSPENGSICQSTACLESFIISTSQTSKDIVYIFKCSTEWTVPVDTTNASADSLEIIESYETLTVAGGGGGGRGSSSGGGGAGGLIFEDDVIFPEGDIITISVGKGGLGSTNSEVRGGNGMNSSIEGKAAAIGGGGGGSSATNTNSINRSGFQGGSGGGSANFNNNENIPGASATTQTPPTISAPNNSSVFGYNGGASFASGSNRAGGGGGGAGSAGNNGSRNPPQNAGGNGGNGRSFTISGTPRFYAGGGGGNSGVKGSGGSAIGGNADGLSTLRNGMTNTGSGGGATSSGLGGNGGSGIVIIRSKVFVVLPVEFLYFETKYNPSLRSGDLTWATAKEWESSHFEIERSVNGVTSWTKIAQIEAQGYSEVPTKYSFSDSKLPASGGIVYYRLKQVDFNGKFSFSNTKSIKVEALKGTGAWIAYPNPSYKKSMVKLDLIDSSVYSDEPIIIRISDIKGVTKTYTLNQIESVSEVVNEYLDRSISGIYILQLVWGNNSQQLKLLRQ